MVYRNKAACFGFGVKHFRKCPKIIETLAPAFFAGASAFELRKSVLEMTFEKFMWRRRREARSSKQNDKKAKSFERRRR